MFKVYHSNRLENLLDQLTALVQVEGDDPLREDMIVVQNQGMARWLSLQLAERAGVAANLEFPLPASFIWRVFREQLDEVPERSPFDRETLLWRIMGLLPSLLDEEAFAPLRRYLEGEDEPLRRFQLSRRIADLFDQYLVFRPEWVLAWEAGRESHWQARLWRAVCGGKPAVHRARLFTDFGQRVRAGQLTRGELPSRVMLFGLTAIAPAYLEVLAGIAEQVDLHLFVLNPSLNYWGDIVDEKTRARLARLWHAHGREGEVEYLSVGNPLLASLGKQGRDFLDQLHEFPCEDEDRFAPPSRLDLLNVLQLDILMLQARGEGEGQPRFPVEADDRSLQVHSCHSPLREVQVLHDHLLDLFETLPGLTARDVVVMAPDIDAYAPYIEAVFGAVPSERYIPWSIADRRIAAEHPVIAAFFSLLALPESRFAASEVMSLLEVPAVMQRFGLDEAALERVRQWVRESNIRWGADGAMREAMGLPGEEANSWAFGLRRLLLGYAMPPGQTQLYDGILPYADVEGGEARHLGSLHSFVSRLQQWRATLNRPRPAEAWPQTINYLLDAFFLPDEASADALQKVREALDGMREHCTEAGFEAPLELEVVRDYLRGHLETPEGGQPFLNGRVSFCNMVPMRSIPFRVVCLLGMNDRDYPREQRPLGFDLMAREPRRGDRSRREDDRYLFLEALLSAREVLYLSYVGRDIRDNSIKVPSVLLGELLDAVEQGFEAEGGILKRIVTDHPLQPFSPRYFDGEAGLFSYAREWVAERQHRGVPPFIDAALAEADSEWREVELRDLLAFLVNPARHFLERRLGVFLTRQEAGIEDDEAFTPDGLTRYQLKEQALARALAGEATQPLREAALAAGELPPAAFGELAFEEALRGIDDFATAVQTQGADRPGEPVEVDLDFGELRLRGWLDAVGEGGVVRYRPAKLKPKDRLRLWLEHLALSAVTGAPQQSRHLAEDKTLLLQPVAEARATLQALLELYWIGLHRPLPIFPASSLEYAERFDAEGAASALARAERIWCGSDWVGGEGADPYVEIAFRGGEPLGDEFAELALALYGPYLAVAEEVKP